MKKEKKKPGLTTVDVLLYDLTIRDLRMWVLFLGYVCFELGLLLLSSFEKHEPFKTLYSIDEMKNLDGGKAILVTSPEFCKFKKLPQMEARIQHVPSRQGFNSYIIHNDLQKMQCTAPNGTAESPDLTLALIHIFKLRTYLNGSDELKLMATQSAISYLRLLLQTRIESHKLKLGMLELMLEIIYKNNGKTIGKLKKAIFDVLAKMSSLNYENNEETIAWLKSICTMLTIKLMPEARTNLREFLQGLATKQTDPTFSMVAAQTLAALSKPQ